MSTNILLVIVAITGFLSALVILSSSMAYAQERLEPKLETLDNVEKKAQKKQEESPPKRSSLVLEDVVVTGTKTERLLIDVPVRTELISRIDIEARGAVDLYEVLESIPGIRVEQQCSYCNFSVLRMQGLEAGHVQVLIDGMPIFSGLASVYGLQQIPASFIERIEIVKGASSALYGSSAIAGVINIITKEPTKESAFESSASFGSHDTNKYSFAASGKRKNMDMMLGFQKHIGREIDEDGDGLTDRVRFDNAGGLLKVRWKNLLRPDDHLTFFGRSSDESRAGGELRTFDNPFAESAENIKTERYEAVLGYKTRIDGKNEISLNFGFVDHGRIATNDSFLGDYMDTHGGVVPPVDEMEPYIANENLYAADLRFYHTTSNKTRLMTGVQYLRNELKERGKYVIVDPADPDYGLTYRSESKKHADEFGLYLQSEIPLIEKKLELVLGTRYDAHKSEDSFGGSGAAAPPGKIKLKYDEEAVNPRLALMYKPSANFTIRTSVGTGFRVPYGFSEDLHLCSGSPRVYKGVGLKPEKALSLNLGADYSAKKYSFGISLFRTNLKDKIGFVDASPTAAALGYTYEWANIDDAYTQGVELSSKVRPIPKVTVDAYLTFTDAQYKKERADWVTNHPEYAKDSKHISRVPEMTAGLNLKYRPGKWNFVLGASHSGRMYIDYCKDEDVADPESKIKYTQGYWVVNAKVNYHVSSSTAFFAGVKNLFDRTQKERHPDDAAFMYAPYTGRIVYGGIEVKF